jgi:formate C-acetyltransferase
MIRQTKSFAEIMADGVERVRKAKRNQHKLTDWFEVQRLKMNFIKEMESLGCDMKSMQTTAEILCRLAKAMPISISSGAAVAGSQDCAFSPSYSLINPSFRVETFAGYCDTTAIYNDISSCEEDGITAEDIKTVRSFWDKSPYVSRLKDVYAKTAAITGEVAFFMEPVTGHTIPDLRPFLKYGVEAMQTKFRAKGTAAHLAMAESLEAVTILARRYAGLAEVMKADADCEDRALLERMITSLKQIATGPAKNMHDAVQLFVLLWQVMVLEQSPNPYAFSVGNLDRILQPYLGKGDEDRKESVELVRNLLCFFQVADRCWAISQNFIVGGKNADGDDLTCEMSYVVLDAFFKTNDPQPALSVKVHHKTPEKLRASLGRFFFTPGHSTPSLFNDDVMFGMLKKQGIAPADLADYSIAGCQEPLIMGKSSLNTTNTWLNLGKVLELATNDGKSLITGKQIAPTWAEMGYNSENEVYANLETVFEKYLDHVLPIMAEAGNSCTKLLGEYHPVPLCSALMDGYETGRDMRDQKNPGCRYNGSGCLIHGLAVVADSLFAAKQALGAGFTAEQLRNTLQNNFKGCDEIRSFLDSQDKFGNACAEVDEIAARLAQMVAERVSSQKNNANNAFLADFSTPSTHLLYGYWVGATLDGRRAREMLNYGVDGQYAHIRRGFEERCLSAWRLPFLKMTGGYASHIGLAGNFARGETLEEKGLWMWDKIISPLFRLGSGMEESPYYVYFNIDSAENLRAVLANPKKYAPDGIYIMRIHGTFVNFLDLSPAIQEDIILRIEAGSEVH